MDDSFWTLRRRHNIVVRLPFLQHQTIWNSSQLKSKLQLRELRIRVLEERLRLMRIEKYGAGGEKLCHAQMQLFEPEPVVSEMIEQAEPQHFLLAD